MAASVLAAVAWGPLEREVSRIPIPGSMFELVIFPDDKDDCRYQIHENHVAVTEMRLLGPSCKEPVRPTTGTVNPLVTVSWDNNFVEIDVARRLIVADSNQSGQPRKIRPAN